MKRIDTFTVKTYHCRPDGRMKIDALMRRMQEAAAAHAQQLGLGLDWLNEIECYWVLSNFVLEIARLPRWSEAVSLQTWPSGHNRVIATREFLGHSVGGDEFFRAGSEWMVLSRKSNRPRNLAKFKWPPLGKAEGMICSPLERLEAGSGHQYAESIRVPYSALDMNGHVNNTEYVRWGMDILRQGFGVSPEVRRLQITYLSEVFEGDSLDLQASATEPGRYLVAGKRAESGAPAFQMEITC